MTRSYIIIFPKKNFWCKYLNISLRDLIKFHKFIGINGIFNNEITGLNPLKTIINSELIKMTSTW